EPDRKVPWQLTLDVPSDVGAFSNTPIVRESALDAKHKRVEFAQTLPLPSYLVAFAVGSFDVVDAGKTRHDVPLRFIAPRGGAKDASKWTPWIRQIIATYEDWFDIPYPYPKLDIVAVPRFGLGGMENAGLITIEETALQEATLGVVKHEIAHQWFGDLVTHAWWDDVWLTEKMASWMAGRVSKTFDSIEDRDLVEQSAQALHDLARRSHPIRVPIATSRTLDAIDEMYDYNGDIFSLFESYLGGDTFRHALQIYLKRHAHGTATAQDFAAALSEASGQALDASFMALVEKGAVAHLGLGLSCASGHRVMVAHLSDTSWPLPMCFAYDHDGKRDEHCEVIEPTTTSVELPSTGCPKWFLPGVGGVSLAETTVAQNDTNALLGPGWEHLTQAERRGLFITLRDELEIVTAVRRIVDGGDAASMRLAARS
ncbi:MAG TPA: M1 family metallopeptidase, partial [Kofleriaceae bacterium]|nr:M1 family metallopeptidase [Kofleriaceae bacterium]